MCISANASLGAFSTNLIACIALLLFGNKNLMHYNVFTAVFLTFVSLMQLVDYGIWTDLDCSKGFNKIASTAGALINFSQPIIGLLLAVLTLKYTKKGREMYQNKLKPMESGIFKHFSLISNKFNFIKAINLIYIIMFIIAMTVFFTKSTTHPELLCTKVANGHLRWSWFENKIFSINILKYLYHIVIITVIAFNPTSTYLWIALGTLYTLLAFSTLKYSKNSGEIWCYLVNITALVMLVVQKLFPNYIN